MDHYRKGRFVSQNVLNEHRSENLLGPLIRVVPRENVALANGDPLDAGATASSKTKVVVGKLVPGTRYFDRSVGYLLSPSSRAMVQRACAGRPPFKVFFLY